MFARAVLILSCISGYDLENFIAYKKINGQSDYELIIQSRKSKTVYFLNREEIYPMESCEPGGCSTNFRISNAYSGRQYYGSDSEFYVGKSEFDVGYEEFGRSVINNIHKYCVEIYKQNDSPFGIKFHHTMGEPQLVNVTPVNISYDEINSKKAEYILKEDYTQPLKLAEEKLYQLTPPKQPRLLNNNAYSG